MHLTRRGRKPKLSPDTAALDDVSIAAAVEVARRYFRFKPLRDQGKRGKEGVYRYVSRFYLGHRLGPESVEKSYKRWKAKVATFAHDNLVGMAEGLRDRYNPRLDFWSPDGDPPLENPRHRRWYERNRLRLVGTKN